MGGFGVNSYVVHAPDGDIVVDAGAEPEKILAATRGPVAAVLVTHGHADHVGRSEEHTSELQSRQYLVCRLLLEKKKRILLEKKTNIICLDYELYNPN